MTITNGYTTLALWKARASISSTNAADDALIETLIEQASRTIDTYTGRRFFATGEDETHTYTAEASGILFTDDILSITTLKTDEDGDRTYEITWAVTDYDLLPENGAPFMWIETAPNGTHSFPAHRKGIQIVGKFGYCAAAPKDIVAACEEIVTAEYKRRLGLNTEGSATVTGAGVVITPQGLPKSAVEILRAYQRLI